LWVGAVAGVPQTVTVAHAKTVSVAADPDHSAAASPVATTGPAGPSADAKGAGAGAGASLPAAPSSATDTARHKVYETAVFSIDAKSSAAAGPASASPSAASSAAAKVSFTVHVERGLFEAEPDLRAALQADLSAIVHALPAPALAAVVSVAFWVD